MKKYECKSCGSILSVPEDRAGALLQCGVCGDEPTHWREVKESQIFNTTEVQIKEGVPDCYWYSNMVGSFFTVINDGEGYEVIDNVLKGHVRSVDCKKISLTTADGKFIYDPDCKENNERLAVVKSQYEAEIARLENNVAVREWEIEHIGKNTDAEVNRLRDEVNERDDKIERLETESADWEETAGRMSDRSSRQFGEIEDLKAENSTLKERITSLKCSLSDVATELDRRIKGLESDLGIERKKASDLQLDKAASEKSLASEILGLRDVVAARDGTIEIVSKRATDRKAQIEKLTSDLKDMYELIDKYRDMEQDTAKRLEAERKKKVTLSITMDSEKIDSFLEAFPDFKMKESDQ